MTNDLEGYFPEESERKKIGRLIKIFYSDILLDESVSDLEATVLVVYMAANKEKTNSPNKKVAQAVFNRLGRSSIRFSKAVYEAINRKNPPLLKGIDSSIGLTFAGKEVVDKILSGD